MKKCLFCGGKKVHDDAVMDFCDDCGVKVWGSKMLEAIKKNYKKARDNGDLHGMNSATSFQKTPKDL